MKREASDVVWTDRRPGIERVCAEVKARKPWLGAAAIAAEAKRIWCAKFIAKDTPTGVVVVTNPQWRGGHPPIGTPGAGRHGGNSTPAGASVRGPKKSERTGERASPEVNAVTSAGRGG